MDYKKELELKKNNYNQRLGKYQQIKSEKENKEISLANLKENLLDMEKEKDILYNASKVAKDYAKIRLETTVTTALQYVFGPNYSAEIDMDPSSSRPVADIYVIIDYGNGQIVRTPPQDSNGGGIVDIIAIALRIAVIQLHNEPTINGSILLDEPGKHVSANYSIKLAEFLKFISINFNKQIIFSTHNDDLKSIADISYNVNIENGSSVVRPIADINKGVDNIVQMSN